MDYLVHHMLRSTTESMPDKEAVVDGSIRLSYQEFWREVQRYGLSIRNSGVARNDRVGILLQPGLPLATSIFAVSLAGGIFVPIHPSLLRDQVSHIIRDCGIRTVITNSGLSKKIAPDECGTNLENLLITDGSESTKSDHEQIEIHSFPVPGSNIESTDIVDDYDRTECDLAAILYTSGSTGLPKGVMLSHRNLISGASIVSDYLSITDKDRILAALPFSFDAGLNQLTTSVQQGATIVLIRFLFAREVVAKLHEETVTGLAGVPPLWNLLVQENSGLKQCPPESLRYVTNTGGTMTRELLQCLRSCLKPTTDIVLMYGLTEAFRSTYLPPEELDRRPGSMGKAIPNSQILVVGTDGRLCKPHETGELVHAGPTVAMGYWGRPDDSNKVFRPHPLPVPGSATDCKVVYSGDLVYQDEDRYFYFVGRRDTLIKTAGFRVSPTEVEEGLLKTGQISMAAVVGIPDPIHGQCIIAFVVPKEARFDADQVLVELSGSLPRHMLPKKIIALDTMPTTSSGKVDYARLGKSAVNRQSWEA